jgi:hypothetical protein
MTDPYDIIGVRSDASLDEIRIAYRRSVQVLHPDRFETASERIRSEAARRLAELTNAMETIESQRQGEGGGTGGLGSVSLGRFEPEPETHAHALNGGPAVPEAPEAPEPEPVAAEEPEAVEEPEPEAVEQPEPVAVEEPEPVAVEEPAVAEEPEAEAEAVEEPVAEPEAHVEPEPVEAAAEPAPVEAAAEPEVVFEDEDDASLEQYVSTYRHDDDAPRGRGRRIAAVALLVFVAIGAAGLAYTQLAGGGTGTKETLYDASGAPVSFSYPASFSKRVLGGGTALNRPTFQVVLGPDDDDYLLVSTYRLGFHVLPDGSAANATGQKLTADQLAAQADARIESIGKAAHMVRTDAPQPGTLGSVPARVYHYRDDATGKTSTFYVALHDSTEYFVNCQSTTAHSGAIQHACDQLASTFQPTGTA